MITLNETSNVKNIAPVKMIAVSSDFHKAMRPMNHMKPTIRKKLAT